MLTKLPSTLIALILLSLPPASCQTDSKSIFLYPTGGETFLASDILNATLNTAVLGAPAVITFCQTPGSYVRNVARTVGEHRTNWILVPLNVSDQPLDTCWLRLRSTDDISAPSLEYLGRNSETFRINNTRGEPRTIGMGNPIPVTRPGAEVTGDGEKVFSRGQIGVGAIAGISATMGILSFALLVLGVLHWRLRRRLRMEGWRKEIPSRASSRRASECEGKRPPSEMADPRDHTQHELATSP